MQQVIPAYSERRRATMRPILFGGHFTIYGPASRQPRGGALYSRRGHAAQLLTAAFDRRLQWALGEAISTREVAICAFQRRGQGLQQVRTYAGGPAFSPNWQ